MKRARCELLAGARLAADQDDLRVRREPLNQAEDFLHDRAASEHAAESELPGDLAFERDDVGAALELFADVHEHVAQPIEIEGLGEIFTRAELDCFDRTVDCGVRGHENDFAAGHVRLDLPEEIEAVHVRHPEIDHREIRGLANQHAQRLGAAGARLHVEAGLPREALHNSQYRHFIVDDEQ